MYVCVDISFISLYVLHQFMDSADEELRKDVKEVSLQRIQALLQLAVQTSTLASDPHREDLTCSLASHNLIQHLHLIQVRFYLR